MSRIYSISVRQELHSPGKVRLMDKEFTAQQSWWSRSWKWLMLLSAIIVISITFLFSSGMDSTATDLIQAYADTELYENALEKVKSAERVKQVLGEIKPIDRLAILEGQAEYSDDHNIVNSSIRIIGTKGKATMDISAKRRDNAWHY